MHNACIGELGKDSGFCRAKKAESSRPRRKVSAIIAALQLHSRIRKNSDKADDMEKK